MGSDFQAYPPATVARPSQIHNPQQALDQHDQLLSREQVVCQPVGTATLQESWSRPSAVTAFQHARRNTDTVGREIFSRAGWNPHARCFFLGGWYVTVAR
jgi:hypothetical protein